MNRPTVLLSSTGDDPGIDKRVVVFARRLGEDDDAWTFDLASIGGSRDVRQWLLRT